MDLVSRRQEILGRRTRSFFAGDPRRRDLRGLRTLAAQLRGFQFAHSLERAVVFALRASGHRSAAALGRRKGAPKNADEARGRAQRGGIEGGRGRKERED